MGYPPGYLLGYGGVPQGVNGLEPGGGYLGGTQGVKPLRGFLRGGPTSNNHPADPWL